MAAGPLWAGDVGWGVDERVVRGKARMVVRERRMLGVRRIVGCWRG